MTARDDLAAEIRKHLATETPGDPPGYWWYDDGQDGDLPEALAADLIAAGWLPPPTGGDAPKWPRCGDCGQLVADGVSFCESPAQPGEPS